MCVGVLVSLRRAASWLLRAALLLLALLLLLAVLLCVGVCVWLLLLLRAALVFVLVCVCCFPSLSAGAVPKVGVLLCVRVLVSPLRAALLL